MLTRLEDGRAEYWRDRFAVAENLMDAIQTGQVLGSAQTVRRLLSRLAEDPKWEVRKVVANGLNLLDDGIFDDLSARLLDDSNGFVRRSAEQSFRLRRRDHRQASKRDATDRQLANRLTKLRAKYGEEAVRDVIVLSELRFTQLVGSMAHDMRSILAHLEPAARGLRISLEDDFEPATVKRRATRVVDGLAFMGRCIADMERYTELVPVERRAEDLAEVLHAACEMAVRNIEELGFEAHMVVLKQNVPEGLRLQLSRHHVIMAVCNLVKNSYESFMKTSSNLRRGQVAIDAESCEDEVRITIRDDGMGMAAGDLDDLDSGMPRRRNKAKRKSTGFGVPIARRYIEAHSGTLTFESAEDSGTTATITLPRTPPETEGAI
ncbi:MAG: HAMP domain-containing sensor histidine kinase [Ectothiorhodospiraceae bacterium]